MFIFSVFRLEVDKIQTVKYSIETKYYGKIKISKTPFYQKCSTLSCVDYHYAVSPIRADQHNIYCIIFLKILL